MLNDGRAETAISRIDKIYYENQQWTLAADDDRPLPNIVNTDKLTALALREIYRNTHDSDFILSENLYLWTNSILQNTIDETSTEAGSRFIRQNAEFVRQLKYNTGVFSAFKAHTDTQKIMSFLIDTDGKPQSFHKFRKDALPYVDKTMQQYLKTEYNTALRAARMAANWKKFESTKHIYPNLEYIASRSAHPREAHRRLWGTIRPMDDSFWTTYMPPSAWNCKCSVRATRKQATKVPEDAPDIPPEFQFNPGTEAKLFGDKHPYFDTKHGKKVFDWHKQHYQKQLHHSYANKFDSLFAEFNQADVEVLKTDVQTVKDVAGKEIQHSVGVNSKISLAQDLPRIGGSPTNETPFEMPFNAKLAELEITSKKNDNRTYTIAVLKNDVELHPQTITAGTGGTFTPNVTANATDKIRYRVQAVTDEVSMLQVQAKWKQFIA